MNELPKSGRKNWFLVTVPVLFVALIATLVIWPWMRRIDMVDPWFACIARLNAILWVLVLWWSSHQLLFQIAALFKLPVPLRNLGTGDKVRLAVLYLTCDDFQERCCQSCLQQDYPKELFRVLICDDGTTSDYKKNIERFVQNNGPVEIVRRGDRKGYKAGNLNHVFRECLREDEEWVVIADADQELPKDFLSRLATFVVGQPEDVAFLQGGHDPAVDVERETLFQNVLGAEIPMFYDRDLSVRGRFGFVPFLGHGAAVRKKAWLRVGGFPELVSEDYAFSLRACGSGLHGIFVEELRSKEAFPHNYASFLIRLGKFSSGSSELLRTAVIPFLRSSASLVEKFDFGMLLFWYVLMPIVIFNGFLSAYVCHRWWSLNIAALHPLLPYLFLSMFLLAFTVIISVTGSLRRAARYWFWATAVHAASLPYASWRFVLHLWKSPSFERTPKGREEVKTSVLTQLATVLIGVVACFLSCLWMSPFSPVLAAHGTAFVSFPLFLRLADSGFAGKIARFVVLLPGAFFLLALYTMWTWGRL